jgi:uncharacterized protein (TIGR02391 family)
MQLSVLTPDRLTALPVDRRAVEILRAIVDGEGRGLVQNRRNVRLELEQYQWQDRHTAAARAYEEGFDWLAQRGLVAREPTQEGPDWFFVTERGWAVVTGDEGLTRMAAERRLDVDLHPLIAARVRSQYLLGEYEAAAFLAMRQVEIRVRELAGASQGDIGTKLMRSAFKEGAALDDPYLEPGERQAVSDLFAGAIGVFKNPSSHRQVDFGDPTLASEVVLLADLLLRLLDERTSSVSLPAQT